MHKGEKRREEKKTLANYSKIYKRSETRYTFFVKQQFVGCTVFFSYFCAVCWVALSISFSFSRAHTSVFFFSSLYFVYVAIHVYIFFLEHVKIENVSNETLFCLATFSCICWVFSERQQISHIPVKFPLQNLYSVFVCFFFCLSLVCTCVVYFRVVKLLIVCKF